jgi:hypothetical protein
VMTEKQSGSRGRVVVRAGARAQSVGVYDAVCASDRSFRVAVACKFLAFGLSEPREGFLLVSCFLAQHLTR